MSVTICTFNANNLYVRYKFGQTYPGDRAAKSMVEDARHGYLPPYNPALFELFQREQRDLTAQAVTCGDTMQPDVLCLQEIESLIALRRFNEECMAALGKPYKYALLIDSRDFRQIDVGILSNLEILHVRSHMEDRDPELGDSPLFSRDCLEVDVALDGGGGRRLTLFINHLKSKLASTPAERTRADERRMRQATRITEILVQRFKGQDFSNQLFAVVGDFNDEPDSDCLRPLVVEVGLKDALARLPEEERWTHWYRSENSVSQLDSILLSPALDALTAGIKPQIERRGVGFSRILVDGKPGPRVTHFHRWESDTQPIRIPFQFERFAAVSPDTYASDHCPVFLEIPD